MDSLDSQLIKPSVLMLVKSGSLIEIYKFAVEITFGAKPRTSQQGSKKTLTPEQRNEVLLSSARRSKRNIKRLIYANVWRWFNPDGKPYTPIPITLTFRENVQDVKIGNLEFTKFIRRLNYEVGITELGKNKIESKESLLQYVAVIEFQPVSQRVHYHILFFNLPYMVRIYDRMEKIWGRGIFNVNGKLKGSFTSRSKLGDMSKVVDYYCKYITKACYDERLFRKKKFFPSRGLFKPVKVVSEDLIRDIWSELPKEALEWEKEQVPIPYLSSLDYYRYNLANYPKLEQAITRYINPHNKLV